MDVVRGKLYKAHKLKINTFILLDWKFLQSKEWILATQQWPLRKLFNKLKKKTQSTYSRPIPR